MFRSVRQWSEKAKIEIVFKLQFHATQAAELNVYALMIFVFSADIGKESGRLEKAIVKDGVCQWKTPVYETVKFVKEPKTGKIKEKLYHFVVSTGVSKSCVIGAASIDLADYASTAKSCVVSLPLKYSKSKALLHVTIQRQQPNSNLSDVEQNEDTKSKNRDGSLKSYLGNGDIDGSMKTNSTQDGDLNKSTGNAESNFNYRPSSFSCMTTISSNSSSGLNTPTELGTRSPNIKQAANGSNGVDEEHRRISQWDWSEGSDLGTGTDDSTNSSQERSHQASSDDEIDKLKAEVVLFSRRTDFLDLELQTLRKQIIKESKIGQDLTKEVALLKHERDAFQAECHKIRGLNGRAEFNNSLRSDGAGDPRTFIEETKEELNHAKEINSNLRLQLEKTQDSNAELLLAIQDLDNMLKEKDREISNLSKKKLGQAEKSIDSVSRNEPDDDEEQKALENIVKDHSDAKQTYLLEQHIMDLETELEIYRRDKEELEFQTEQLALDYEILKQENHDMSYKLEQSQLQEQLKLQYECSHELEMQIENLENKLEKPSKDFSDSPATIKDLQTHIKTLEEEIEKQARGFEADFESVTDSKVKQEQRAIRAEQALRMAKQKNVRTAERMQEDLRILSEQMGSTFDANEKVATQALADASELRVQNGQLQDVLKKTYEQLQSVKDELNDLSNQLEMKKDSGELFVQKRHAEEIRVAHSQEKLKLKAEVERLRIENNLSAKQVKQIEKLEYEIEKMKISIEKTEVALQRRSMERNSLVIATALLKKDSNHMVGELNRIKCFKDENERAIGLLQSELATVQNQSKDLKRSLVDDELEKEKLRKQMFQLKDDLKKKEDALTSTEMKLQECNRCAAITKSSNKTAPVPVSSKEVTNLKEKLKLLGGQIKSKEAALETSTKLFLEKEKELKNKIEELESRLGELSQSSTNLFDDQFQKEATNTVENGGNLDELLSEMAEIKEKNKELENELKEMQERYSEISLKFAEVEGEREQLVMTVRSLKNARNKKT